MVQFTRMENYIRDVDMFPNRSDVFQNRRIASLKYTIA